MTALAYVEQSESTSDLTLMWESAVAKWEHRTKMKFNQKQFLHLSMDQMREQAEKEMNDFEASRHDKSKTSMVRAAFGRHIGDIQKILDVFQGAANVASVFPPAMPAGLLFSAAGRALKAFSNVSADYDEIETFYDKLAKFLDQLSVIHSKPPPDAAFQRCITRVFSHQLDVLGIAQQYAETKHHLRRVGQWLTAIWTERNGDLVNACQAMDNAINELRSLMGFETFSVVQEVLENQQRFEMKLDQGNEKMTVIGKYTADTYSSITDLNKGMERLLRAEAAKSKVQGQPNPKSDVKDKKQFARNAIRRAFNKSDRFSTWDAARLQLKAQKQGISNAFVANTCLWFTTKHPGYASWVAGDTNFLHITGKEGIGKSFLSHAAIENLLNTSDDLERRSVAYFYFKEESVSLQSTNNALACAVWQVAGSNSRYAQQAAIEIGKKDEIDDDIWASLIAKYFSADSDERLFLVLDGLDEAPADQKDALIANLTQVTRDKLKISVLITSRPNLVSISKLDSCATVEVTKADLLEDMESMIKSRCKSLPRLSKFPKKVQRQIETRVKAKADGMLYIEHMLRRLSYIGRVGAVLKDLKDPPEDLQALYRRMITECHKNRSNEQYEALKQLFAWLAFSKRPLALPEAEALVKRTSQSGTFDIEDEIIGRSARLLEVARSYDDDDDNNDDQAKVLDETMDDTDLDSFDNSDNFLTFQERSLREFFRALDVDDEGLRTPPSAAHLKIFQMAMQIIIEQGQDRKASTPLLDYAGDLWTEHFMEIDIEQSSDGDVVSVLTSLHHITTNAQNVAGTLEDCASIDKIYPVPRDTAGMSWLDVLRKWIARAETLPEDVLDPQLKAWVQNNRSDPDAALAPLAKGHVINWYKSTNRFDITQAFACATAALNISVLDIKELTEVIHKVAGAFPDLAMEAGAMRAIGTTLDWYGTSSEHFELAVEYLQKSVNLIDEDCRSEKFYTLGLLSDALQSLDKPEDAVAVVDQAIAAAPVDADTDAELRQSHLQKLISKARLLMRWPLERNAESINVYNEARHFAATFMEKKSLDGYDLDDLLRLVWDDDKAEPIKVLQTWTDEEVRAWIEYLVDFEDTFSIDRLHEAAKKDGSASIEFLLTNYAGYEKSLQARSTNLLVFQAQRAKAFRDVVEDVGKEKELYKTILYSKAREEDTEQVERIRSLTRLSLAELLFNEFRSSSDPAHKKGLLQEMVRLDESDNPQNSDLSDLSSVVPSYTDVMLALMWRALGPSTSFQTYLDKTFKTCVAGLRDDTAWNDRNSLRLLAKVLACVEGRQRDSLIALSCQFSQIDTNLGITDEGSEINEGATPKDHDDVESQVEPGASQTTGVAEAQGPEQSAGTSTLLQTETGVATCNDDMDATNFATQNLGNDVDNPATGPSAEDISELNELDEDLIKSGPVACDGCGTEQDRWKRPMYYCIICWNCDLCQSCYEDRMALNRSEKRGDHWRKFCGENHKYIKGPMPGWRGIKDGVLRIGEEETTFVNWLKGLEDVRWKEAWDMFWRKQGEVGDIFDV